MKILIVEDEDVLLRVLQEKFEGENFKVFTAKDGSAAITSAKKNVPDAILLDILLPKVDGFPQFDHTENIFPLSLRHAHCECASSNHSDE